jgi:cytochrome P450
MSVNTSVRFNPFSAEFRRDPYPAYRQLRENNPVHRTMGMWVLTRHADVRAVLHDRSFGVGIIPQLVSQHAGRRGYADVSQLERLGQKSLVFTENPDHARLRGIVNRVFTAPAVARLRPSIAARAQELLRRTWERGTVDAVAALAEPLPIDVMCDWMALPKGLREHVGQWTHDTRFLLEPGLMKGEDFAHVQQVVRTFAQALDEVVAHRKSHPGDDLISQLLSVRTASGDRLTEEELIFVCIMCFVAGNETTKSLIGNALLALLQHPGQDALLRQRPDLMPGMIDEALRYDCPLQQTKRLANCSVRIRGQEIQPGDQVLVCLGAANRDPEVFTDPDRFDITRNAKRHLAFGHGMHGCLGGMLAELQTSVAFETLYAMPGRLELGTDQLEWQDQSFIIRGLKRLPVVVRGKA